MSWSEDLTFTRPVQDVLPVDPGRSALVHAMLEDAYNRGYRKATESLESVYNSQILELRKEIEEMRDGVLTMLEAAVEDGMEGLRNALPALSLDLVRSIMSGVELDHGQLVALIENAIPAFLDPDAKLVISLAPDDYEYLNHEDLTTALGGRPLELKKDPQLKRGDFQVKSPLGYLDGSLEKRIRRVEKHMEGTL